jgi:hypothetical protein
MRMVRKFVPPSSSSLVEPWRDIGCGVNVVSVGEAGGSGILIFYSHDFFVAIILWRHHINDATLN